ncbi:alpha-L-fucosidase [Paenibacillus radicis (ex Xue et al. 2023)]|uniref:alpha-L-fucosidase n=1 Tax=Paenibacillus radicis (ex Xue et al. 2023) TaxID=2972489 RepID=A0ABT1YI32_9BACL|nr:alpha-L-fucosidase [Paenibacillus radicis (ex Xue et al. 2023)]MCR8631620.1 alpha-L-fucosidase [Paenibacillus radicis (ex Xue et al. 2023)]
MITRFKDARDVFFERRFGLFVHWGLYAIPAWHEQILWRGDMKRKDYEKLIHEFNPVEFNPDEWLDMAEQAGMQYLCFTTKHHDGFCMWDTKHTDYNIMNSAYGKDILGMLAEACHRRNFPLSLYYSCPDWHHPNYPNQGRHHEMFGPRAGDDPDIDKYYDFVRNQLIELCTKYGKIYQLFWDVNVAEHEDPSLNEMIRELQPGILINDRGPGKGDYNTPERHVPEGGSFTKPTEACQALGRESWGYKEDEDYYSNKFIMQSIDKIMAMGGNYLLNVGPKPNGRIARENVEALRIIGEWYHSVKESFGDALPASDMIFRDEITMEGSARRMVRDEVLATRRGNTLYIHLHKDTQSNSIVLKPLNKVPNKATLLNDGRELEATVDMIPWAWRERPYLRIRNLPVNELTDTVMILKLEFDEAVSE